MGGSMPKAKFDTPLAPILAKVMRLRKNGVVVTDAEIERKVLEELEAMVSDRDMNNWWEGVLYSFIEEGMDIFHEDVDGAFWTEVDTPADYDRLISWTSKNRTVYPQQPVMIPMVANLSPSLNTVS